MYGVAEIFTYSRPGVTLAEQVSLLNFVGFDHEKMLLNPEIDRSFQVPEWIWGVAVGKKMSSTAPRTAGALSSSAERGRRSAKATRQTP